MHPNLGSGDLPMSALTRRTFWKRRGGASLCRAPPACAAGGTRAVWRLDLGPRWRHCRPRRVAATLARLRDAGFTASWWAAATRRCTWRRAHAAGLVLHRWVWALNRSGDAQVKAEHPEWFSVNRNGESSLTKPPYVGYYQWLCPHASRCENICRPGSTPLQRPRASTRCISITSGIRCDPSGQSLGAIRTGAGS